MKGCGLKGPEELNAKDNEDDGLARSGQGWRTNKLAGNDEEENGRKAARAVLYVRRCEGGWEQLTSKKSGTTFPVALESC